ncbi:sporozoite and liver stage asparagine-rich protein, putative [Plasmodium gallinaceum]|uniref:Sporozoite and liver stage asparagine-rich protein, putative n=1 Tax=Plasmodium gallinaceum TaxID=5849 RepID=A0A1J1GVG5_PLAGA|nr:sporozoite and liver stage asparagine-rich protein, putative [Plasmodium gallinaceum]CRG96519.1 sporozoite and liver stage asparagine-rich protein, putative [Plasmodium gallinaceum]
MRKGKPRHVPMFLRSENKKIFFTFFSYFMPKNDLNFIFEYYDIGLIVLTKIHNIRKKYEDEKNNLQNQDNKSDIDDIESFDEKVRTFFLNYKIKSNKEETIDNKKLKNEKHKKSKRNVLNNENNQEHLNKKVGLKTNNGLGAQQANKETNNFSNENKELFKINGSEIINANLKKKNKKVKAQESINNSESYLKSVKLEIDKCSETNQSLSKNECDNMNISNLNNNNANSITKANDLNEIEHDNMVVKTNKEQNKEKKEKSNEIEKRIKKEENIENKEKIEIKKEINENEEMYENEEEIGEDETNEDNEKHKQMMMRELKKVKKDLNLMENTEEIEKKKVNDDTKIEKESDIISFPLKKKNETYKKFSKRINRKKINEFVDDHDDYCFYITDLCKKGTMLSLKKNELINDKNEKYKLNSSKFMDISENNKNCSFNESHSLNNNFINTKLNEHFKENKISELKNLQKCKESFPQNSTSINENIILQNAYQMVNNNNGYNLSNIENLQHKDNFTTDKNLQNSIYYLNGQNAYLRNSLDENNINYFNLNIKNKNNVENKTEITDEEQYFKFLGNNENIMNDKKKSYIKYEKTKKISQNKSRKKNYSENNKKLTYLNDQSSYDFANNKTIQMKNQQLYPDSNYDHYNINNQNGYNNFYSNNINEIKNDINEQNNYTNNNNGNNKGNTKNENINNQIFHSNDINNYGSNFNVNTYQNSTNNINYNMKNLSTNSIDNSSNINTSNSDSKNIGNNNYYTHNQISNNFVNISRNNENNFANYNININYLKNDADGTNYTQNGYDENDNIDDDDNNNNDNDNNYVKMNMKNDIYINDNINNSIYFNNNEEINNYTKSYIRNSCTNENVFNNYSNILTDNVNDSSNSANITTYIENCNNSNIYDIKNNDKNEYNGKHTSSYINKMRNTQYNSNNNMIQNEIFNKINENNTKDQNMLSMNKNNSQSSQEEQLNHFLVPLTNVQSNKKNTYKNSIYTQNDNIREHNFSFNFFNDNTNFNNSNFMNLKKIKEEIEGSTRNSKNSSIYETKSKMDIPNNKSNMQNVYNNYSKMIENNYGASNLVSNQIINNDLNLKYLNNNSLDEREEKKKENLEKKTNLKEEKDDYEENTKTHSIIVNNENIKEYNYLINAIKNENPNLYNISRSNINNGEIELNNDSIKTQNQNEDSQFLDEKKKYIIKNSNNIAYSISKNIPGKKIGNQITNQYNYVETDLEKKRKKLIQDDYDKNISYHQLKEKFLYNEKNSLKKIQAENKSSVHHYIDSKNNLMDENNKIVDQFLLNNYDTKNVQMNDSSLLLRNVGNNKYIIPSNIENDQVDNNINNVNCLKDENVIYNNEDYYKIKNINKNLAQNSKSYIMAKHGCYKNTQNNLIEIKPNFNNLKYNDKYNYEITVKNMDNSNTDMTKNINIDIIRNENSNCRNNIIDSKVSVNEEINTANDFLNNDNSNFNNYMINDEINTLEYAKFYTDDNAETKSFSEINDKNSAKNILYIKNKEDFEMNDLGLVTDIENYNYKNKSNSYIKEMKANSCNLKVLQDLDNYIINENKNYNQEFIDNFSCNGKLEKLNLNNDDSKNMYDTFYKKNYSKNDNYNNENIIYANNLNKNFKNNSKNSFVFYDSSSKYAEEKNINDENNKHPNNNTSLYENMNNNDNFNQEMFDNKDRIMTQSSKSLNFPTSNIYCDNNKTTELNEKGHMDSQNFLNNNYNKISENFLKKNIESSNNIYNIHNTTHNNYSNECFFNREDGSNEVGNLMTDQSHYYLNDLNNKKIMNNLNTNSVNEMLKFNNSNNINSVNNTNDIRNIHNNICQNNYNVEQNHSNINGNSVYNFDNNYNINNIDQHSNINTVHSNNVSNCNTYNNYNNVDINNNLDIIKIKDTNNNKNNGANNFSNLNNLRHVYSNKVNSTDSQLNPINDHNVNDNFSETKINVMDKCKNMNDSSMPYSIENINYLMNKIDNSNSFYDNYKLMNTINCNEKISSDENIYKDSNFNLKKLKNFSANNTSNFKNPYLYMNKNTNAEEVDTITYENINEINNNVDHIKNDSSSTCCDNNNNNSNNELIKNEIVLNGLYDNINFDSYKNNTSLILDLNKNKQRNNFYESYPTDHKDKQKNNSDNLNNSTNLINCKTEHFNSKNSFNLLSNNITNLNDFKNINDLNNINCLNDFKDTDTINKLIGCNDKNNTNIINNFKNINELNRVIGVKNMNDSKTDNINLIFRNIDKINNVSNSDNLKSFSNNNMNNINDNINKNLILDNSYTNTLGNNGNIFNKEHLEFDPNNINFLKNYNFNSYMSLLQLNKINDYYNSINNKNLVNNPNFNLNVPLHLEYNNMNVFANQKKIEFDKQSNKSYINEMNSNCEKNTNTINNYYASSISNIHKNNKEGNVNISKSNISDDYVNNFKHPYVFNNGILNIDSKKNINNDINKNFVNYENQIKYINNSKGNIVNYDNYNINEQNKNANSIFSLDSLKYNLMNNNSNYVNLLNNICNVYDDNSNIQDSCTNNKLMLNNKNEKRNQNINELYDLKSINPNENRIRNSIIPVNFPVKNYYNFQLLLNVLKGKQLYNSFNPDTGKMQNNNDMNLKNNKKNYSISSVGFSNRSKRWTICPSYICCNSALCRFKLTCNFKFLQFNQAYNTFNIPYAIYNCYKNIMNNYHYFTSTLCPQQTYLSKHSAQEHETIFNVYWHLLNNEKYKYIQNIILFLDSNLYTRAVWLLKKGHNMNDFEVQRAEKKLIKLMLLVFKFTYEFKNDNDKYEHIKSFLYSIKNSHINFEIMNRFLFY